MNKTYFVLFFIFFFVFSVEADSWKYQEKVVREKFDFGSTKIEKVIDARKDVKHPDFYIEIYYKDILQAQYKGVSFDNLIASKDNKIFYGISNYSIPGTAIIVFDDSGNLLFEGKHSFMNLNYCEESVTLIRKWYQDTPLKYHFVFEDGKPTDVMLLLCDGQYHSLYDLVIKAR